MGKRVEGGCRDERNVMLRHRAFKSSAKDPEGRSPDLVPSLTQLVCHAGQLVCRRAVGQQVQLLDIGEQLEILTHEGPWHEPALLESSGDRPPRLPAPLG